MSTITPEKVRESKTYKDLKKKKEAIKCGFLEQLEIRKALTNGFEVWKNTGEIPNHFAGIYRSVLNDLIEEHQINTKTKVFSINEIVEFKKGIDANYRMTSERVILTNGEEI